MDAELLRRRRVLALAREQFEDNPDVARVRTEVRASWERCAPILEPVQVSAPVDLVDEVADRWDSSPIRRAAPELIRQLEDVAVDGDYVAAVTDEDGRILWSYGGRTMRRRAEKVNFTPGGRWDEASAGTNALGLALLSGRPETVFSAEHWCAGVQDWVCYSAPVRDPLGRSLGVIDLSSTWNRSTSLALATVTAMARVVEQELRSAPATGTGPLLRLQVLGRPRASLGPAELSLSLRQVEILTVLALVGACTLDELHTHVYGERPVSPTTTRVEVSHLRHLLGGAIASRPYRLTVPVETDLEQVLGALAAGDLEQATAAFSAPVLVASDAPFIVERRHHLDVALRTALLARGNAAQLVRFAQVHPWDVQVLEAAVRRAPDGDPVLATAAAMLSVALGDLK